MANTEQSIRSNAGDMEVLPSPDSWRAARIVDLTDTPMRADRARAQKPTVEEQAVLVALLGQSLRWAYLAARPRTRLRASPTHTLRGIMTFITHLLWGLGLLTSIMAVKQVDVRCFRSSGRSAVYQVQRGAGDSLRSGTLPFELDDERLTPGRHPACIFAPIFYWRRNCCNTEERVLAKGHGSKI